MSEALILDRSSPHVFRGGDICSDSTKAHAQSLIVGIILTALAAIASYYCFVKGFPLYDSAISSLERFGAGFLIYSGVVFSIVAAGNALYTGGKQMCHAACNEGNEEFTYTSTEKAIQIGVSILAPIAAVPVIVVGACGLALNR